MPNITVHTQTIAYVELTAGANWSTLHYIIRFKLRIFRHKEDLLKILKLGIGKIYSSPQLIISKCCISVYSNMRISIYRCSKGKVT